MNSKAARKFSQSAKPRHSIAPTSTSAARLWLLAAAVMVLTFLAFIPVLAADFVLWDDDVNITENPHYRGLDLHHLRWMWTAFHLGHYQPLTWMSFGLDYTLWGMNPVGYHLTNLLLHAFNAALCFWLARTVLREAGIASPWPAVAAALLFAVHPLRVESVAWATERRDVLSGLFFLLTLLAYFRMARERRAPYRWLILALLCCAASLLAKAWAISIPALLLVLDAYPLRRIRKDLPRVVLEKVLFVALVVPFVILAGRAQQQAGATKTLTELDLLDRLFVAAYGLCFYVWKTVLPTSLAPLYEIPKDFSPWQVRFLIPAAVVIIAVLFLLRNVKRRPGLVAAAAAYLVILSPVLGLYQSGVQLVADRYTYLACISWTILLAAALDTIAKPRIGPKPTAAIAAAAVLALAALTFRQTFIWNDTLSLWARVVRIDPDCRSAHNNIGLEWNRRGRPDKAVAAFEKALQAEPDSVDSRCNLAGALVAAGQFERAVEEFRVAIRSRPDNAAVRASFAQALQGVKRYAEAVEQYHYAIRLDPNFNEAYYNLAALQIHLGRRARADETLGTFLKINKSPDAAFSAGVLWARTGHYDRALALLRDALTHHPDHVRVNNALAWLLATCPDDNLADGPLAVRHAQRAVNRADQDDPGLLDTLAAAYARAGQYEPAVDTARRALTRARAKNANRLADEIENRLNLYKQKKPYREHRGP